MKCLIFDSGPIISLATNNLLNILKPLKQKFKGKFYLPQNVKAELIDKGLNTNRFRFEALRVLKEIREKNLEYSNDPKVPELSGQLDELSNTCFISEEHYIKLLDPGELDVLANAIIYKAEAIVIDERTTRMLIEDPKGLLRILEKKLHKKIKVNQTSLDEFRELTKNLKVIRSTELVTMAYELGLLDKFIPSLVDSKKLLVDGFLWGLKLNGCAITPREIERISKYEVNRR
jgi:hypothetical protein